MGAEATLCETRSQFFKGLCLRHDNCATICEKEGYISGRCKGFLLRCICAKDCGPGVPHAGGGPPPDDGGGGGPPADDGGGGGPPADDGGGGGPPADDGGGSLKASNLTDVGMKEKDKKPWINCTRCKNVDDNKMIWIYELFEICLLSTENISRIGRASRSNYKRKQSFHKIQ